MTYEKPCVRCGNDEGFCNGYMNCAQYRAWINWSWAQYRAYPARRFAERLEARTSWTYYHPDELRQCGLSAHGHGSGSGQFPRVVRPGYYNDGTVGKGGGGVKGISYGRECT